MSLANILFVATVADAVQPSQSPATVLPQSPLVNPWSYLPVRFATEMPFRFRLQVPTQPLPSFAVYAPLAPEFLPYPAAHLNSQGEARAAVCRHLTPRT